MAHKSELMMALLSNHSQLTSLGGANRLRMRALVKREKDVDSTDRHSWIQVLRGENRNRRV